MALALILFFVQQSGWSAPPIPAFPERPLYDQSESIEMTTRDLVSRSLTEHQSTANDQIVIGVFSSISKDEIESFSKVLYKEWKIGNAYKNNGILLVVGVKEQIAHLEVGYGLESIVTPQLTGEILGHSFIPTLQSSGINRAIKIFTRAILEAVGSPVLATQTFDELLADAPGQEQPTLVETKNSARQYLVAGVFALLALGSFAYRRLNPDAYYTGSGWTPQTSHSFNFLKRKSSFEGGVYPGTW